MAKKVFVTGAIGFIDPIIVLELIHSGCQVLGLVQSDAGPNSLLLSGAEVGRGRLEDLNRAAGITAKHGVMTYAIDPLHRIAGCFSQQADALENRSGGSSLCM
jgi:hypothetical protein